MPNGKDHLNRGTFGGSKAADVLDNLLCEVNNQKLISKIGRVINRTTVFKKKLDAGVTDKDFKRQLRAEFFKKICDDIDISIIRITICESITTHNKIIKDINTHTKNVIKMILNK